MEEVSPEFTAAIRRTLGEIALKSQKVVRGVVLDADKTGNRDTDAYKQAYTARYLFMDVSFWQVENAYSAPDCCWRKGPLSAYPSGSCTGWQYGDAEYCT